MPTIFTRLEIYKIRIKAVLFSPWVLVVKKEQSWIPRDIVAEYAATSLTFFLVKNLDEFLF